MNEVTIVGADLAKNVFQFHGATVAGAVVFCKKPTRPQFRRFMTDLPACLVVMEACDASTAGAC